MFHIAHFCMCVHIYSCLKMQYIVATVGGTLDILRHCGDAAKAQDGWYCVVCSSQKGNSG